MVNNIPLTGMEQYLASEIHIRTKQKPGLDEMTEEKREGFSKASWANILGNIAKMIAEASVGFLFGSIALIADATHSGGI